MGTRSCTYGAKPCLFNRNGRANTLKITVNANAGQSFTATLVYDRTGLEVWDREGRTLTVDFSARRQHTRIRSRYFSAAESGDAGASGLT